MADGVFDEQASTSISVGSGAGGWFFDSSNSGFFTKDDAGVYHGRLTNAAVTSQAGGFAADTWLTGSDLQIPSFGFQAKTLFFWKVSASKTGAGVATPIYIVRIGSTRSTSDTARLTLTGPAQTAVADIGTLNIMLTVRNTGASGVIQGTAWWDHTGTAANTTTSGTGFANDSTGHVQGTAAGFDMTTGLAGNYISLSLNGGTSAVWSPTQVVSEVDW